MRWYSHRILKPWNWIMNSRWLRIGSFFSSSLLPIMCMAFIFHRPIDSTLASSTLFSPVRFNFTRCAEESKTKSNWIACLSTSMCAVESFVNYRDFVFETWRMSDAPESSHLTGCQHLTPSSAGNRRNEIEIKKERNIYVEKKKSEMKFQSFRASQKNSFIFGFVIKRRFLGCA